VTQTSAEVAAPPAAPPIAKDGVLPAGASIMVRMVDVLSTEAARTGAPFEAELATAIRDANGTELLPAGSKVYGRVIESKGGGAVRKPRLAIGLSAIEAPGHSIPITTSVSGAEGGHGGAAKKIGAGALIGAAAGDVGAGAAVGTAAVLLSGGNQIVIPRGTLVEFNLSQPVQLR
jgi:hypothetical protein